MSTYIYEFNVLHWPYFYPVLLQKKNLQLADLEIAVLPKDPECSCSRQRGCLSGTSAYWKVTENVLAWFRALSAILTGHVWGWGEVWEGECWNMAAKSTYGHTLLGTPWPPLLSLHCSVCLNPHSFPWACSHSFLQSAYIASHLWKTFTLEIINWALSLVSFHILFLSCPRFLDWNFVYPHPQT